MEHDVELDLGDLRDPLGRRLALPAAGCALGLSLVWFLMRLSPGVAFGPWQGVLLGNTVEGPAPALAGGLAALASYVPVGNVAWRLNLVSAGFGALSCAVLAALGYAIAGRFVSSLEAAAAGLAAALLFAATPAATYAATAAGPSTLSLFLPLTTLALLVRAAENEALFERSKGLYWAALATGLAACNNAAFGLMLGVLVLGILMFGSMSRRTAAVVAASLMLFLGVQLVPLLYALAGGTSGREYLAQFLRQPYPTLYDAAPSIEPLRRLGQVLPIETLLVAVSGVLFLFRRGLLRFALLFGVTALAMGPLLPAMTNQSGGGSGLRDNDAPFLLMLALVCLCAGWGVALLAQLLSRQPKHVKSRTAAIMLVSCLLLALEGPGAPTRNHSLAHQAAERILAGCPRDSVLVCGGADLTSLVTAAQRTENLRPDVTTVPAQAFAQPRWERRRLAERLSGKAKLDLAFPPPDADKTWPNEQPVLFARFLAERARHEESGQGLVDLALWSFIKENRAEFPVCFAGVQSPWLAARAEASGWVLVYPRVFPSLDADVVAEVQAIADDARAASTDPGLAATLTAVLLPLADAARAQGQWDEALRLAATATALSPDAAGPRLASLHTEACRGQRDAALAHAAEYLERASGQDARVDLQRLIEEDLEGQARGQRLAQVLDEERKDTPDLDARQDATDALWEVDALAPLMRGYDRILAAAPDDPDALYQLAAACTQLGDLAAARDYLARWMEACSLSPQAIADRLHGDGRFVLLQSYHGSAR